MNFEAWSFPLECLCVTRNFSIHMKCFSSVCSALLNFNIKILAIFFLCCSFFCGCFDSPVRVPTAADAKSHIKHKFFHCIRSRHDLLLFSIFTPSDDWELREDEHKINFQTFSSLLWMQIRRATDWRANDTRRKFSLSSVKVLSTLIYFNNSETLKNSEAELCLLLLLKRFWRHNPDDLDDEI